MSVKEKSALQFESEIKLDNEVAFDLTLKWILYIKWKKKKKKKGQKESHAWNEMMKTNCLINMIWLSLKILNRIFHDMKNL